jgi:hypothetical protein
MGRFPYNPVDFLYSVILQGLWSQGMAANPLLN